MSAERVHLAVGDSAAGMLSALRRDGLLDGEVLPFIEDLSAGPLLDADAIDQGLRLAWHQQLLQAQPWLPECEDDWLRRHQAGRKALLRLLERPRPLTVWQGRNAGDRLALALLAEQLPADCPLTVCAAPEPVWQAGDEMAEWSMAMLPLERLPAAGERARPLTAGEREALAAQWRHWREHGQGLRRLQDDDVVEAPLDRYDALLLELSGEQPRAVSRLVGDALVHIREALLSSDILFWRVQQLLRAGRLRAEAPAGDGAPPLVRAVG
ncbi:hypothetical protein HNO92_002457 [Chromobacterium alkanivorans]|uniref:DUF1835 domain-containing protein n=1 Tax=Chromobacterium alkanivorans TaxID=1071719 RepID=UPI0021687CF2|nr:DUF1835 domain-containing protein [Chromobacterium alkanivorans]MCS3805548.1 hypothetical protein [Chromobacterium alkanivorans]MCS3819887.1 hypothetical protein [Chromobacterium alkanivorans]MCS3874138.1 hypothetical protein [Chromobacterium alkanivorans]